MKDVLVVAALTILAGKSARPVRKQMEARIKIFVPHGTRIGNDDFEAWVRTGKNGVGVPGKNLHEWLNEEGVLNVPHDTCGCYFWDDDTKEWYARGLNGETLNWTYGYFETSSWISQFPFTPARVEATVYWWWQPKTVCWWWPWGSNQRYKLGEYFVNIDEWPVKATLELETLSDGRVRYRLFVVAPRVVMINDFVGNFRQGKYSPVCHWVG